MQELCRNSTRQRKAIIINKLGGKKVQVTMTRDKAMIRGVIAGIPTSLEAEQVKESIKRAKVKDTKH